MAKEVVHGGLNSFREELRRYLSTSGLVWAERAGPPPSGVKILKQAHPPSLAERICEEGFPLLYVVAVKREDSSAPLEEACGRGDVVCFVYGDVEWGSELEGRCQAVTFYVDVKNERKALEALLLFIARTRSLPWVAFNRDVLKLAGLCDEEPGACLTEEVVAKKVEAMKRGLARLHAAAAQDGETGEAEQEEETGRGGAAVSTPKNEAARLDPAVLELIRRCCGEGCVSRFLSCYG